MTSSAGKWGWRTKASVLSLALSSTVGPAAADGDALYQVCRDGGAECRAFVAGFIAGHGQADFYGARRYSVLCLPAGTTIDAAVDVVRDYLVAHADARGLHAADVVLRALHGTWPMSEATCRIGFDERQSAE